MKKDNLTVDNLPLSGLVLVNCDLSFICSNYYVCHQQNLGFHFICLEYGKKKHN